MTRGRGQLRPPESLNVPSSALIRLKEYWQKIDSLSAQRQQQKNCRGGGSGNDHTQICCKPRVCSLDPFMSTHAACARFRSHASKSGLQTNKRPPFLFPRNPCAKAPEETKGTSAPEQNQTGSSEICVSPLESRLSLRPCEQGVHHAPT